MKKIILFLFLVQGNLQAQAVLDPIFKTMYNQVAAWNQGDIPGFMAGYWNNDSLMFIGKKGISYGWKTVLENYQTSYSSKEKMGVLDFSSINLNYLSADAAFVTGKWTIHYEGKPDVGGWFSLVFRKIDDHWLIVADHTSG